MSRCWSTTRVQVPREYVKNGEIVLNISFDATSSLKLGNEFIEFKARFGGPSREIIVPVDRVIAIYARENGQGMAFPVPAAPAADGGPVGNVERRACAGLRSRKRRRCLAAAGGRGRRRAAAGAARRGASRPR